MFSAKHLKIGKAGEEIAAEFIKSRGYKVVARNFRRPWGEIDIIGKSGNGKIVFFEVKTMRQSESRDESGKTLVPEDNMSQAKIMKLRKICEYFANLYPELISEKTGWQIDLITIAVEKNFSLLTDTEKSYIIKHYPNLSS